MMYLCALLLAITQAPKPAARVAELPTIGGKSYANFDRQIICWYISQLKKDRTEGTSPSESNLLSQVHLANNIILASLNFVNFY